MKPKVKIFFRGGFIVLQSFQIHGNRINVCTGLGDLKDFWKNVKHYSCTVDRHNEYEITKSALKTLGII